jgi:hypothetical protein
MTTKEMKLVDSRLFVEESLSIAVSQDQRVLSDIGRLGNITFDHSVGK